MNTDQGNNGSIVVKGIAVDRKLLEARAVCRCTLDQCQARCCGGGVAIKVEHANDILAHQQLILPHVPPANRDPQTWFEWEFENDDDHPEGGTCIGTQVVADSTHPDGQRCIFLRSDRRCALQVAGVAAGEHPWRFKPFYCSLYPLVFDRHRLILDDENEVYRGGGSCQRASAGERIPLYQLFDVEVKLALGEAGYADLAARAKAEEIRSQDGPATSRSF